MVRQRVVPTSSKFPTLNRLLSWRSHPSCISRWSFAPTLKRSLRWHPVIHWKKLFAFLTLCVCVCVCAILVFRAENSNTHRHLTEFVGLDMEMAFKEHYHEVLDVFDGLFVHLFKVLRDKYASEVATGTIIIRHRNISKMKVHLQSTSSTL